MARSLSRGITFGSNRIKFMSFTIFVGLFAVGLMIIDELFINLSFGYPKYNWPIWNFSTNLWTTWEIAFVWLVISFIGAIYSLKE